MLEPHTLASVQLKQIYNKLQDDESRLIFRQRLMYCLTGNEQYLWEMLAKLDEVYEKRCSSGWDGAGCGNLTSEYNSYWQEGCERNHSSESVYAATKARSYTYRNPMIALKERITESPRPVVMYGAGGSAYEVNKLLREVHGIQPVCLCDSDPAKWGTTRFGMSIITPESLARDHINSYVVISSVMYENEITDYLFKLGFPEDAVFPSCSPDKQYFGLDFFQPCDNEIFVDAGAYDGSTIYEFTSWCADLQYNYTKIYGLEPDPDSIAKARKTVEKNGLHDVVLVDKAAWSDEQEIFLKQAGSGSALSGINVPESGGLYVKTAPIDAIVNDEAVTFIKMDVEGAELEALRGASQTIKKYKPKLAISVYHEPDDIINVLLYINELAPDYRFFLRHHTLIFSETVLYAII